MACQSRYVSQDSVVCAVSLEDKGMNKVEGQMLVRKCTEDTCNTGGGGFFRRYRMPSSSSDANPGG